MNSNELFKTFIVTQHATILRGFITTEEAHRAIEGYYKALEDMDGIDELTELYMDLANYVHAGTPKQAENARNILNDKLKITDLVG